MSSNGYADLYKSLYAAVKKRYCSELNAKNVQDKANKLWKTLKSENSNESLPEKTRGLIQQLLSEASRKKLTLGDFWLKVSFLLFVLCTVVSNLRAARGPFTF